MYYIDQLKDNSISAFGPADTAHGNKKKSFKRKNPDKNGRNQGRKKGKK